VKRLVRLLIRLYPSSWRERYGEEFEALMEDSSPGWPAIFDLLKGALKMQLSVPAFPKLALMLSITGLLIGLLVSALLPPVWISQAELRIAVPLETLVHFPIVGDDQNLSEYLRRFEQDVLSKPSLTAIIQDPRLGLYREDRGRKPLEDVIEQMRRDVHIRKDGSGEGRLAFSVAFAYRDRVKAQQTVRALVDHFTEAHAYDDQVRELSTAGQVSQVRRLEARVALLEKRLGIAAATEPADQLAAAYMGVKLELSDPPSLPRRPAKPNRWIITADGFGAGFVAALVIAIFRRRPPPMPLPAHTA
jgi:hypothetical protein